MSVAARHASIPVGHVGVHVPAVDWWSVAYAGAGLVIGGWLGARRGFQLDDPATWEWFTPELGALITAAGLFLGLGLLGLVLTVLPSTRPFGLGLLTSAVFVAVGFPIGAALGPTWHEGATVEGHVRVVLTAPVAQVLDADATCTRLPGAGLAGTIEASPLGRVGIDELHLQLGWGPEAATRTAAAELALRVNADPGYEGELSVVESGHDRLTGRGTFADVRSVGARIGGTRDAAAGEVSWDCTGGAVHTPPPGALPTDQISPLQGWFHLRGIVTVEQEVPEATPPLQGRASGQCSRSYELGTRAIDTVVTWLDGKRARLRLVPELGRATLTVDLGDGSPPEMVRAPAMVHSLNDPRNGRSLGAVFQLEAGRLAVTVDWWCQH